jgi:hypothetical protein
MQNDYKRNATSIYSNLREYPRNPPKVIRRNLGGGGATSKKRGQNNEYGMQTVSFTQLKRNSRHGTGDGILEHQFNKRLESFAPCYSLSLLNWRILK